MKVGLLLLSEDNYYVDMFGDLPPGRPIWDKQFLLDMCTDKVVVCSNNTMITLPPSLFKVVKTITTDTTIDYDINIGIATLGNEDILFITRCNQAIMAGKQFRLDKYKKILKQGDLEIWKTMNKKRY